MHRYVWQTATLSPDEHPKNLKQEGRIPDGYARDPGELGAWQPFAATGSPGGTAVVWRRRLVNQTDAIIDAVLSGKL